MNSEIKTRLINTFGTISYLIVIFFFITLILYMESDVKDAIKEAWGSSIGFLSVLATLGAAYIASSLFNDWREQENTIFKRNLAHTIFNDMSELLGMMFLSSNQDKTVYDVQIKFQKINSDLMLYSNSEPKIRELIQKFGVVYIKQLGIFEASKTNKEIAKSSKMDFISEYGLILRAWSNLVDINISSNDIDLYLDALKAVQMIDYKELMIKDTNEILNQVKKSK